MQSPTFQTHTHIHKHTLHTYTGRADELLMETLLHCACLLACAPATWPHHEPIRIERRPGGRAQEFRISYACATPSNPGRGEKDRCKGREWNREAIIVSTFSKSLCILARPTRISIVVANYKQRVFGSVGMGRGYMCVYTRAPSTHPYTRATLYASPCHTTGFVTLRYTVRLHTRTDQYPNEWQAIYHVR